MARKHDDEQLLNGELAKLLSAGGVPAEAEQKIGRRKIDVIATVDGVRVMLEAEAGFKKKRQAIQDADARLKQGLAVMAFAVCYEDDARAKTLATSEFMWTLRTKPGNEWQDGDWSRGAIADLCSAVRHAPAQFDDVDGAAKILSIALDTGAARLTPTQREELARAVNLPAIIDKKKKSDGYLTAGKRGLLVLATAILFHHRVHEHLPRERPDGWAGDWRPKTASQCASGPESTVGEFRAAWQAILSIDYKPVFETALFALDALPVTADADQLVRTLARTVEQVARLVSGMRHDLLGRIFHKVLDTARYDGSFYTSTAAATLLAGLAIREEDCEWGSADSVSKLRICDPACGTGTLLMAAAQRVQQLREQVGTGDDEDDTLLSEALVEDVLWGYDINITAAHMAASALGMLSPETQFRNMNVHIAKYGLKDGRAHTGSLDLLDFQMALDFVPGTMRQVDDKKSRATAARPRDMDFVIMNPPFTRDSLRHDHLGPAGERAVKAREKEMLAKQPHKQAARLSGSANAFLVLAEKIARSDDAVVAVVVPTVIATNPAARATRTFLAARFHIDMIVTSHDPTRINMSENTTICESLIICRRSTGGEPSPPTRFINLSRNPVSGYEAMSLLQKLRIEEPSADFTLQLVDSKRISSGDWFASNFYSPYLVAEYLNVAKGKWPSVVPITNLESVARVGPAGQRIRDAYTHVKTPVSASRRALWQYEADATNSMQAATDWYIEPKSEKKGLADKYWRQRSHFLLPARWRLDTGALAAVRVETRAVGSLWVPFRPRDDDDKTGRALCAWFNSAIGVLAVLGGRANSVLSRPDFSLDAQRSFPVPDLRESPVVRDALAAAFTELQDDVLLPLAKIGSDPVRRRLDDAVVAALGLDAEWVAGVRRALSEEPSVTNRRFGT